MGTCKKSYSTYHIHQILLLPIMTSSISHGLAENVRHFLENEPTLQIQMRFKNGNKTSVALSLTLKQKLAALLNRDLSQRQNKQFQRMIEIQRVSNKVIFLHDKAWPHIAKATFSRWNPKIARKWEKVVKMDNTTYVFSDHHKLTNHYLRKVLLFLFNLLFKKNAAEKVTEHCWKLMVYILYR